MWGGPCLAHSPLSPADGRFRGAAPGHTGETLGPPSLTYPGVGEASPLPVPRQPVIACTCSSFLQPGKLTEAFKYFLQGMGYSKYTSLTPSHRLVAGGKVGLAHLSGGAEQAGGR